MSRDRLRNVRKLIEQGRHDVARDILQPMSDDPTARAWLDKLEAMKPRRRQRLYGGSLLGLIVAVSAGVTVIVVGALALTRWAEDSADQLQDLRQNRLDYDEWEQLYSALVAYCSPLVGYGAETCLDWATSVVGDGFLGKGPYYDVARECLAGRDLATPEAYAAFGTCLAEAGVPPPGY